MAKMRVSAQPAHQAAMMSHDEMMASWKTEPGFNEAKERLEREEFALLDALLEAREASGLTQAEIAARMGTKPPAVSRLLTSLASDRHSPSVTTLRKYAKACGKELVIKFM